MFKPLNNPVSYLILGQSLFSLQRAFVYLKHSPAFILE